MRIFKKQIWKVCTYFLAQNEFKTLLCKFIYKLPLRHYLQRITFRKTASLLGVTKMCNPLDPSLFSSALVLKGF